MRGGSGPPTTRSSGVPERPGCGRRSVRGAFRNPPRAGTIVLPMDEQPNAARRPSDHAAYAVLVAAAFAILLALSPSLVRLTPSLLSGLGRGWFGVIGGPWQLSLPAPQGPAHGGSLPKAPLVTGQGAVPSPVGGAPSTLPGDGSITPPKPVPPPPGGGEGRQRPHRPAALPPGQHRQDVIKNLTPWERQHLHQVLQRRKHDHHPPPRDLHRHGHHG